MYDIVRGDTNRIEFLIENKLTENCNDLIKNYEYNSLLFYYI